PYFSFFQNLCYRRYHPILIPLLISALLLLNSALNCRYSPNLSRSYPAGSLLLCLPSLPGKLKSASRLQYHTHLRLALLSYSLCITEYYHPTDPYLFQYHILSLDLTYYDGESHGTCPL